MIPGPLAPYVEDLLALYRELPDTTNRIRPADRHLARGLHAAGVPLHLVRGTLMLATVRRAMRPPDQPPLPPVRSLHYFRPVIDELLALKPDPPWLAHVARHFDRLRRSAHPALQSAIPGSRPTGSCPDSRVSP